METSNLFFTVFCLELRFVLPTLSHRRERMGHASAGTAHAKQLEKVGNHQKRILIPAGLNNGVTQRVSRFGSSEVVRKFDQHEIVPHQ